MVNEININLKSPVLEILNCLDQGKVSFEQAVGAIRCGEACMPGEIREIPRAGKTLPEALHMDLGNLTPYL